MNLTKDIQKLTIEGEELPFCNVHISNWKSKAITGIRVRTERKVKKYYNQLWKQTALELNIFFREPVLLQEQVLIVSITDSMEGEYEYQFCQKEKKEMHLKTIDEMYKNNQQTVHEQSKYVKWFKL